MDKKPKSPSLDLTSEPTFAPSPLKVVFTNLETGKIAIEGHSDHVAWMVPQVRTPWKDTALFGTAKFIKGKNHITTPHSKFKMKNFILFGISVLMIFSFQSCSTKYPFLVSSVVPATQGTVKIKQDDNKNYVIKIDLSNLAEPERLDPSNSNYIVWMNTDNNLTKNIGQIKVKNPSKSKKNNASLETISAMKPTKIFLTAENDVRTQYPSGEVLLSTKNSSRYFPDSMQGNNM